MTKRPHPLLERTLEDTTTGAGEKLGAEDLGRGGKITRPAREATAAPIVSAEEMLEAQQQSYLANLNSDLHARDDKGKRIPTLAERIAIEGFDVALHGRDEAARRKRRGK